MKKVTAILLALVLCFGVTIGCKKKDGTAPAGDTTTNTDDGGSSDGGTADDGDSK